MATEQELIQAISEIQSVDTLRNIFSAIAVAIRNKGVNQNPIYPNQMAGLIGSIETGSNLDTSDADATASDLVEGKIAYSKSGRIVGTVYEAKMNATILDGGAITVTKSDDRLRVDHLILSQTLFRRNSTLRGYAPLSNFGNATADDVAAGKTFTSTAGLKVTGTKGESSSLILPVVSYVKNSELTKSITIDVSKNPSYLYAIAYLAGGAYESIFDDPIDLSFSGNSTGYYRVLFAIFNRTTLDVTFQCITHDNKYLAVTGAYSLSSDKCTIQIKDAFPNMYFYPHRYDTIYF